MANMRREQEHLACADRNISDNSLFDYFQHHVPAQLVEELVAGIVVEVDPLVGSPYDLDDHIALIKERLVADRRLEQVPVHVYPALEIKRTLHRHLPGCAPPLLENYLDPSTFGAASFALLHSPTEPPHRGAIIIHRMRAKRTSEMGTTVRKTAHSVINPVRVARPVLFLTAPLP